jgi:hypothetical protein
LYKYPIKELSASFNTLIKVVNVLGAALLVEEEEEEKDNVLDEEDTGFDDEEALDNGPVDEEELDKTSFVDDVTLVLLELVGLAELLADGLMMQFRS